MDRIRPTTPFAMKFYPILDAGLLARRGVGLAEFAEQLRDAGVGVVQYRDKEGSREQVARNAALLRSVFAGSGCLLILNDYAEIAAAAGWDGVHLGQGDGSPEEARKALGPGKIIGVSTHNEEQLAAADAGCADYIAIGPVFATSTKDDADPVIGLDGVRRLRALTKKPLVAIGGITRANCRAVVEAGADAVAVISELLAASGESAGKVAGDFLGRLG